MERVIKPLKAHAHTSSAGHLYSGTSGASIKRLRPTPHHAMETDKNRDCRERVEQIETAMSAQIASGQIRRRRFRRKDGAQPHAFRRRGFVNLTHNTPLESRHITSNPCKAPAAPTTLSDLIRGRRPLAVSF